MKLAMILVFDDVEELDFVGPLEVFGVAGRLYPNTIGAVTCGTSAGSIKAHNGLTVTSDYTFQTLPRFEILVVPGGRGALREMKNSATLDFVKEASKNCDLVTSVCTGALVLAAAGLLEKKKATTHWAALEELKQFPDITVEDRVRYVHDGKVITSAGISAGIDMALYVVELLLGSHERRQVANRMEYEERSNVKSYTTAQRDNFSGWRDYFA